MQVRLVVERGGKRSVVTFEQDEAILGRGRGNAVRIPSADVSRQHCCLHQADGLLEVEDLDSVNGTFVNGDRIVGRTLVQPGDRLEVGPIRFRVDYDLTAAAKAKLKKRDKKGGAKKAAQPMDFLEELGDGSVLEEFEIVADGPEVSIVDDLVELEIVEETPAKKGKGKPKPVQDDDLATIPPDFSMGANWELPEGTQFRDLLSDLSDDK